MAGVIVELFDRRSFDFGGLAAGSAVTLSWWLGGPVSNFTEGVLQLRAHGYTFGSSTASMRLRLWLGAPTAEDPQTDLFSTALAIGSVTLSSTSPASPALLANPLAGNFGGFLYTQLIVTQGSVAAALSATLSAQVVLKRRAWR